MLFCALNLLCFYFASAQTTNVSIKGQLQDAYQHPLTAASVYLIKTADSSLVKISVTNKSGQFGFSNIPTGNYYVNITHVGFTNLRIKPFALSGTETLDLGIFKLVNASTTLGVVTVTGNTGMLDIQPGKIVMHVRNSTLSAGSSALQILKSAPGVQVDNDGNIVLNGKSDVLIEIDGKPVSLSATALAGLLESTQSNMIDQIELIGNPDASVDAGGSGLINIKLKRDKTLGANFQISGTTGYMQPDEGQNSALKTGAGINFNYRNKTLNVYGQYTFANNPVDRLFQLDHSATTNNQVNDVDVNSFNNQYREINNFRVGADYNISPNNIIGFLVNGLVSDLTGVKNINTSISNQNVLDSTISTLSTLDRHITNFTYNVNYKGDFKKSGDLNFDATYINYQQNYNELLNSNYFNAASTTPYRNLVLQNNTPLRFSEYIFNLAYHIALNSTNSFTTGYKNSYVRTQNFSNFGQLYNNTYIPYAAFTSQFNYSEDINAAFATLNHTFSKKLSMDAGLRVEHTLSSGLVPATNEDVHNSYFDFFPNLKVTDNVNDDNRWDFIYRRSISRPKYEDLNPFLTYIDQYTYQLGNPYLKPLYLNNLEVDYTYKGKYLTALTASVTNNFTYSVYNNYPPGNTQSNVISLQKVNLGTRYIYGIQFTDPVTLTRWYSADFNLNLYYQYLNYVSQGVNTSLGSADVFAKLYQHFKLPFGLTADILTTYETPTNFAVFHYQQNFLLSAGISKSVMDRQGTITLNAENILNSDKQTLTSNYQGLNTSGNQRTSFRTIQLSFQYAFGKQTVKGVRRRPTGAEEEQSRTTTGN